MTYKALIIGAALLVAPVAFAQDRGEPVQPPQRGERGFMMRVFDRPEGVRAVRYGAPTTTPDGRPLPGPRNMGSTTNPGIGWGDRRGEFYEERPKMGSTTREEMRERREDRRERMATSTTERPPIRALLNRIFNFQSDESLNDDTIASSTVPRPPVRAIFERLLNWFR